MDTEFDKAERWTPGDVQKIRDGKPGRKVLAYLSIAEAENYRTYWQKTWRPGSPAFLVKENPEWKGNFIVRYWRDDWQQIILAQIDTAMAQGFDGLYLDIVDGFEEFEGDTANKPNPETKQTYRADMIAWVHRIAARARGGASSRRPILIIPQNGSQLFSDSTFVETVSGIGLEDVFTNGNKKQPKSDSEEIIGNLHPLREAGKPVFLIEYATHDPARAHAIKSAREEKIPLLLTDRQLKTLGECFAP
jgi:cysteinyl-tRNA synthetase